MKVYNYISILLLAGTAIFTSCTQGEEPDGENMDSLNGFQISVSDNGFQDLDAPQTRATASGYTTKFADGDAIGVFAVKGTSVVSDINNRKFTMNEGAWELDGKAIEYKSSEFKGMKFYAYYPYNENVTFEADKDDPFETYVSNWKVGEDQSEENYTKCDLMTSVGDVQGERLKGKIAFTMEHRMALAIMEKPQIVYDFTNEGIDDYILKTDFTSFTLGGKPVTPYYQESTDTYRFLVNPGKEYSIKSVYTGVKEMECEVKGTQDGGTAQLYKINDPNKYTQELAVGDYYCADGSIVSKSVGTAPDNAIGVVMYVGNPLPSATHPEKYSKDNDALLRNFSGCTHGLVMALNNTQEDVSLMGGTVLYHGFGGSDYVGCNTGNGTFPYITYPGYLGYNNTALMSLLYTSGTPNGCEIAYNQISNYQTNVPTPEIVSTWYIPCMEELNLMRDNINTLNSSIDAITDGTPLETFDSTATGFYWSSNERNNNTQWIHRLQADITSSWIRRDTKTTNATQGYFRLVLAF